jgi:hypothetical protein
LTSKHNQLVDFCKKLINESAKLEKSINSLKQENQNLKQELEDLQNLRAQQPEVSFSEELVMFFNIFCLVIKNLEKRSAFIPYTYKSKFAKDYLKVEKKVFNSCVSELTDFPIQNFRRYCAQFMLLKSEGSNCIFNSDRLQIYYVNKNIAAFILGSMEKKLCSPYT